MAFEPVARPLTPQKIRGAGWAISYLHYNTLCSIHAITSFITDLILHVYYFIMMI